MRRHRITFQLADGEAEEHSVVGRLKADYTRCLRRGAVCDIFTILAHSHWHRVCAGRAAHHLASRQGPSRAGNAHVLAVTCERSKTVARSKLAANSALHDASLANSRVRAVKHVELFGLSDGAVRTLQKVVVTQLGTEIPYRRRCSRRSVVSEWSMLLHSTWPQSFLRKWQCILPAK